MVDNLADLGIEDKPQNDMYEDNSQNEEQSLKLNDA